MNYRNKECRNELQANQELLELMNVGFEYMDIRAAKTPAWKQRLEASRKAKRIKKAQNWCFVIEGLIIIGILWLIAPQVIEHVFSK